MHRGLTTQRGVKYVNDSIPPETHTHFLCLFVFNKGVNTSVGLTTLFYCALLLQLQCRNNELHLTKEVSGINDPSFMKTPA